MSLLVSFSTKRLKLAIGIIAFTAACSPSPTTTAPKTQTVALDSPNADTMAPDVAVLVNRSWLSLNAAFNDETTDKAEAYAQYGLVCFGNGLVETAEAAFQNAVALSPDEARWIYFLALIHEFQGRLDEAETGFMQVLSLRPDDIPTLLRLGDVHLEQAQTEKARSLFERVNTLKPNSAFALYGLGRVASADGDDQTAADLFERALKLQPQADRLNYLLGLAWRNLGDTDKAKEYLAKRGTAEPEFDDPLFNQISGGDSRIGGLWVHMHAGAQAFVEQDYALAVTEFRAATIDLPLEPHAWQSLGMSLAKVGDLAGAKASYQKALELNPDDPAALSEFARLLMSEGNLSEAQTLLTRSLELDSQNIDNLVSLAQLYSATQKTDQALIEYDKAVQLDPQSSKVLLSRAELLAGIGRTEEALESLAIESEDTSLKLGHSMLLARTGNFASATDQLGALLNTSKTNADKAQASLALSRVYLMQGDSASATAQLNDTLGFDADQTQARHLLARTLAQSGKYEQSLATYESLFERSTQNDQARIEASAAAVLLGNPKKAHAILSVGAQQQSVSPALLSTLARLLVQSQDVSIRDPNLALQIASRGFEASRLARHAETVALCLAATGQFEQAINLQQQLLTDAQQRADAQGQKRISDNLARYRANQIGALPLT